MTTTAVSAPVCQNFINTRWVESRSGKTMERRNPADLSEIASITPLSTRPEVCEAIAAAKAAFPAWRDTPAPIRGRILAQAAALVGKQKDALARTLCREQGKALKESLAEVQRSIHILEFTAGEGRRLGGQTIPSECAKNVAYTIKQPLGVVGEIMPWNFPIAIQALRVSNSVKYGLSSSIFTNDARRIGDFIDRIEAGITHVNAPTTMSEAQMPFGGMKATGAGLREMGALQSTPTPN